MIRRKGCACFGLQRLEHGHPVYSRKLGNLANSAGANNVRNRCLEHDLVALEKRFIDVCRSVRRIPKILVELLLHVPRRRRFNLSTHCFDPENVPAFPWLVEWLALDCLSPSHRAEARLLRRFLRNTLEVRYGLPAAFRTNRLSARNSLPCGRVLQPHVAVFAQRPGAARPVCRTTQQRAVVQTPFRRPATPRRILPFMLPTGNIPGAFGALLQVMYLGSRQANSDSHRRMKDSRENGHFSISSGKYARNRVVNASRPRSSWMCHSSAKADINAPSRLSVLRCAGASRISPADEYCGEDTM